MLVLVIGNRRSIVTHHHTTIPQLSILLLLELSLKQLSLILLSLLNLHFVVLNEAPTELHNSRLKVSLHFLKWDSMTEWIGLVTSILQIVMTELGNRVTLFLKRLHHILCSTLTLLENVIICGVFWIQRLENLISASHARVLSLMTNFVSRSGLISLNTDLVCISPGLLSFNFCCSRA